MPTVSSDTVSRTSFWFSLHLFYVGDKEMLCDWPQILHYVLYSQLISLILTFEKFPESIFNLVWTGLPKRKCDLCHVILDQPLQSPGSLPRGSPTPPTGHSFFFAQEPNSPLSGRHQKLLCMDASPSSQTRGPSGSYSQSSWLKEGCRTQVSDAEWGCGAGVSGGSVISFQPLCRHEAGVLGG